MQHYHFGDRPTPVKIWHAFLEIAIACVVTVLFFMAIIVLPVVLCIPLLSAMESASFILVILAPCFVIYGVLLSSLSYRRVNV